MGIRRNRVIELIILFFSIYASVFLTLSYSRFNADSHYIVINRQGSVEKVENEASESVQSHSSAVYSSDRTYEVDYETYDIPLDDELQVYAIAMARAYGLDPKLIFAVIRKESGYHIEAVSPGGGNVGLMQINYTNFGWLSKDLGFNDFQDPYNNIQAGCYILSILNDRYNDVDKVLMAYNQGEGSAKTFWNKGIFTSHYTRKVNEYMEDLTIEATKEAD